jgi:hypothetical protein
VSITGEAMKEEKGDLTDLSCCSIEIDTLNKKRKSALSIGKLVLILVMRGK